MVLMFIVDVYLEYVGQYFCKVVNSVGEVICVVIFIVILKGKVYFVLKILICCIFFIFIVINESFCCLFYCILRLVYNLLIK